MDPNTLKNIYLFQNLTQDELSRIVKIGITENFKEGSLIFKEGEPGDKLYVIISGAVRISRKINGSEEALAILRPGNFFGEMSLIDDIERSADAIAHEECSVMTIKKDDFDSLLFVNKDLAYSILWSFVRTLSERLRETNEKIKSLLSMKGGF